LNLNLSFHGRARDGVLLYRLPMSRIFAWGMPRALGHFPAVIAIKHFWTWAGAEKGDGKVSR
jgi:hypothetical protein